MVSGLRLRT